MKIYNWATGEKAFLALALAFSLNQPVIAAVSSFSERTVELQNINREQWEFKVQFGNTRDSIFYIYTTSDGASIDSTVETNFYSDTAPAAVLLGNSPILAWSSMTAANQDSDIYFANWTGRGWSEPQMVHADNTMADMLPELEWSDTRQLVLSWWRNTGNSITQMRATYSQGNWVVENDLTAAESKKISTKSSSYYSTISARSKDDPFKCIAIGDSITAGCKRDAGPINLNEWCNTDRTGETTGGYVDTLQALLQNVHADSKVYNYGHPGERSYEGAARINDVMSEHSDANCILIMFGANDRYEELLPTDTSANIKLMADLAIAEGIAPVITTITPNTSCWYCPYGIDEYNVQIEALATGEDIIMADQYGAIEPDWDNNNSGDGLHLSDAGDILAGYEWYETMESSSLFFPGDSSSDISSSFLLNYISSMISTIKKD